VKDEPNHSAAFHLVARIQERIGRLHEARAALVKAHEIEPHFRQYVFDLLRIWGKPSIAAQAREVYEDFHAFIEYPDRDLSELMARILIHAGRLDEVRELSQELEDWGDTDASRSLEVKRREAEAEKSKAYALMAIADELAVKGEYDRFPRLVREAYELCPFDFRIIVNQAIAYRECGKFLEAAALLNGEKTYDVSFSTFTILCGNAAYNIQAGKFDTAMYALTRLRDLMVESMAGKPVNPVDIPGVMCFLTMHRLEETAAVTLSVLELIPESTLAAAANREVVSFFRNGILDAHKIHGFTAKPTRNWLSRILSGEWLCLFRRNR